MTNEIILQRSFSVRKLLHYIFTTNNSSVHLQHFYNRTVSILNMYFFSIFTRAEENNRKILQHSEQHLFLQCFYQTTLMNIIIVVNKNEKVFNSLNNFLFISGIPLDVLLLGVINGQVGLES